MRHCITMCFDICTINIRVSIRVRGLHLFFIFGKHQLTRNQATFSSPERCPEVHLEERARRASRNSLPIFLQVFHHFVQDVSPIFFHGVTCFFHLGMTSFSWDATDADVRGPCCSGSSGAFALRPGWTWKRAPRR